MKISILNLVLAGFALLFVACSSTQSEVVSTAPGESPSCACSTDDTSAESCCSATATCCEASACGCECCGGEGGDANCEMAQADTCCSASSSCCAADACDCACCGGDSEEGCAQSAG